MPHEENVEGVQAGAGHHVRIQRVEIDPELKAQLKAATSIDFRVGLTSQAASTVPPAVRNG